MTEGNKPTRCFAAVIQPSGGSRTSGDAAGHQATAAQRLGAPTSPLSHYRADAAIARQRWSYLLSAIWHLSQPVWPPIEPDIKSAAIAVPTPSTTTSNITTVCMAISSCTCLFAEAYLQVLTLSL
jgi:hypothetical protein